MSPRTQLPELLELNSEAPHPVDPATANLPIVDFQAPLPESLFDLTYLDVLRAFDRNEVPPFVQENNHVLICTIEGSGLSYCTSCYYDEKLDWLNTYHTQEAANLVDEYWDCTFKCLQFTGDNWYGSFRHEYFCIDCEKLCIHYTCITAANCPDCQVVGLHNEQWLAFQSRVWRNVYNYRISRHRELGPWMSLAPN